jgi:hypothetical protein
MTGSVNKSPPQVESRPKVLAFLATVAGILFGILAIVLEGAQRATFASIAIVLLAVAAYCASAIWLESSGRRLVDLEEPPGEPPAPGSQVALIHDPGTPLSNTLQVASDKGAPERGRREHKMD